MITYITVSQGGRFKNYLFALLQSIREAHADGGVQVLVLASDLGGNDLKRIRKNAPFSRVMPIKGKDAYVNIEKGAEYARQASGKIRHWRLAFDLLSAENDGHENLVFMDCDTAVYKNPIGYFDQIFDIGFTYKTHKDEGWHWPINSGVLLAKSTERTSLFFQNWQMITEGAVANKYAGNQLRNQWGGEDQAALGAILGTRDRNAYAKGAIYGNSMEQLQGFPCEELNETRCAPLKGNSKIHIIHYKGKWRNVIPNGTYTAGRPKVQCQEMFDFWKGLLLRWNQ